MSSPDPTEERAELGEEEEEQQKPNPVNQSGANNNDDDEEQQEQNQQQQPSPPKTKSIALFVLFQHGVNGHPGSLSYLKDKLMGEYVLKYQSKKNSNSNVSQVHFFDTKVNSFFASNDGVVVCANRLVAELVPEMKKFADLAHKNNATTSGGDAPPELVFDVVGLSFGGVLVREVMFQLEALHSQVLNQFRCGLFVTIASPHCGVWQLPGWKLAAGAIVGSVLSLTYEELLLKDSQKLLSTYLVDDKHIAALARFEERLLVANVQNDHIVAFGTSSLLADDKEAQEKLAGSPMASPTVFNPFKLVASAVSSVMPSDPGNVVVPAATPDADLLPSAVVEDSKKENETDAAAPAAAKAAPSVAAAVTPTSPEHAIALQIAAKLRANLTWTVVAVKPDSWFKTAHHAIVGASWISSPLDDAMAQIGEAMIRHL